MQIQLCAHTTTEAALSITFSQKKPQALWYFCRQLRTIEGDMTKVKILLVEDDKSLREIYGVRLLAEGYDIVSAGDGEEALAMAIKERPQLIISDVMMPKISGFDMLDILRSTTETRGIKVIIMTALSSQDQRMRGEALGADRYLVKSQVGIEDVVRTVHEVLEDDSSVATGPAPLVSSDSLSETPTDTSSQEIDTAPAAPVSPESSPVAAPTVAPRPNPASSIPLPPPRSATLQVPQPHAAAQPVATAAPEPPQPTPAVQQPAPAPTAAPASAPNSEPKLPPTPPTIPSNPSVAPMQPTVVSAQEQPPSAPQIPQAPQPAPSVRPVAPAQPVPAAQTTAAATAQALSIPVQPIPPTGTPPTPAASSPSTLSQQPAVPSAQPATSASISSPAASAPAPADNTLSGMQFEETLRTDVPASQRTTL